MGFAKEIRTLFLIFIADYFQQKLMITFSKKFLKTYF